MSEVKRRDQELYESWKETGDKKTLGELVNQLNPLIYSEVKRASGSLPTSALSAEAKKWTYKAIQTYDPTKGASISTHVVGYLPKIRRMNYKFQNMVRLPENLQLKYHDYNQAVTNLSDRLNRDPSDEEIAKELNWSKAATVKYKSGLYADLVESAAMKPTEYKQFDNNKILYDYIMSQLTTEEKLIFDNKGTMPASELASKLGVNINRLNYLSSKLIEKIKTLKQDVGLV
jgi:DNA-directed RNA polymerase specialized sigma subunit